MNKFYEAANILSVFFVMPVLIFLGYNFRTNKSEVQQMPQIQQLQPNIPITPGPIVDSTPVPEKPSIQPDVNPVPEQAPPSQGRILRPFQQQPHRYGPAQPVQPRRPLLRGGNYGYSAGSSCGPNGCNIGSSMGSSCGPGGCNSSNPYSYIQ